MTISPLFLAYLIDANRDIFGTFPGLLGDIGKLERKDLTMLAMIAYNLGS